MKHTRFLGFSLLLTMSCLVVSACVVDKSKYTFDDDEFDKLSSGGQKGSGGRSSSSGGEGGEGGDDGAGGTTESGGGPAVGGQGGDTGSGGGPAGCLTGDLECNGKQLEICTGTDWLAVGSPCEFVCSGDQCTGVCEPDDSECVSDTEQRVCTDEGLWETEPCDFACVENSCGGVCAPGDRQCGVPDGGLIPVEVCDATGTWKGSTTICQQNCDDGVCTGGCNEDETQCGTTEQGDPAVLTCPADGADWSEATVTACVNQACVNGACVGECKPTNTTCSGKTFRTCTASGTWNDTPCPFVCAPDSGCFGVCEPGTEKCEDEIVLRCNTDGKWEKYQVCEGETPLCVHLTETNKACGQCNPPRQGETIQFCHMTSIVECTEKGLFNEIRNCGKDELLCNLAECFDPKVCNATGSQGCFDAGTGWTCGLKGKPAESCRCDCSDGIRCESPCLF